MRLPEVVSKAQRWAFSRVDARRFAICVLVAVFLHVAGAFRWRRHPHVEKAPPPEPTLIPVALEPPPPPPPPPKRAATPKPPAPPPPKPPTPPTPQTANTPPPPPLDRPRATLNGERPTREPHAPRAREHHRQPKAIEASAFGGKDGVFDAAVCLLSRSTDSALAVDGCEPVATFKTSVFDIAPRRFTSGFPGVEQRVDWFGIDYHGRFKVRAADYYTFRLLSDDGAMFYIDGALVVNNDGKHGPRSEKMSLPLSQGEHEFRLMYFQGPGGTLALQLFVKSYKSDEHLFGPEL